ncbi:hypothetical protein [Verrucosispora sp. NA02020]|uniref:hypothetical protein n=1 Tax=Verrucosispora sp. NA02020 TaxID=2742132 RepID=UPI0015926F9A|nr:hypothetical protein [Verrucosispora sp. NA02020]QKW17604.1 hypothetical protein HUT12_32385 [Verrucosispora sp. NA02020]
MILDATGPDEIRTAFHAAIAAAGDRVDELGGIAGVLSDAADRYETLEMEPSTVEHLRDASRACGTAQAAVATATGQLRNALTDFNNHDGAVADTVADAGTLASKEILMGDGSTPTTSGGLTNPLASTPSDPAGVGDVLGVADGDTCHGTDQVPSAAGPATTLALMDYGDGGDRWDGGRYVAVGTSPHPWHPVTGAEHPTGDEYAQPGMYHPPHLDPAEAETAARHLDELADLAEAGHRPPTPTKWGRAAQRLEHLIDRDCELAGVKVAIGDDELPVNVRDLLALLRDKEPATGPSTRRHVTTAAIDYAGGDPGTLWMDLVDHDGATRIAVTGVEGDESPDSDYWQPYIAQHTPVQARDLADRLRTFAHDARSVLRLGQGADAPYLDWSTRTADGGRNLAIGAGRDAVSLDLNPTQLRELHDALTATITADDFAEAPGGYWPEENSTRYIDWSDFEYERGFLLGIGDGTTAVEMTVSAGQLRAWRDRLATDLAEGKPQ